MQYIIKFFADFTTSEHLKEVFEKINETDLMQNYGKGKEIYITTGDDYTHAFILNAAMPSLTSIPKENVIGIAQEPPVFLNLSMDFVNYAKANIGKYYIGEKYDLPEPFVEGNSYLTYMAPLKYIPIKTKTISIIVSHKNYAPGHKYRHILVQKILSSQLQIDIYGNGTEMYNNFIPPKPQTPNQSPFPFMAALQKDSRIKGKFNEIEPYESYDFTIAIENFQHNHYFSEKIINPLLCGTTPVYYGCKNIESYFPDSTLLLNGNLEHDFELLKNIVRNPQQYKKNIDVDKVKQKVKLFENLDTV
jgi:hypothetical protein